MPQSEEKQTINKTKQNKVTPIVLWLFPLLLINIGWIFFVSIDSFWQKQEQIENANQEIELLSAKSDFSYCLLTISNRFCDLLKSDTSLFHGLEQQNALIPYIKNRSDSLFRSPFPQHDLIVFKIDSKTNKTEIIYSNNEILNNKDALNASFEYFVKINNENNLSPDSKKAYEKLAGNIFGNNSESFIFARKPKFDMRSLLVLSELIIISLI